jgi:phospho-N-acetylmuramoyl-pentapeptide-transferase
VLYALLVPLSAYFSAFNVFRYITFRSVYAAVTALALSFVFGPWLIRRLRAWGIGQQVRSDGPQTHLAKSGTPTMGGLLIVGAIVIPTLLWADLASPQIQIVVATTLVLSAIGFLDDYRHAVQRRPKGLRGRYKLAGQLALGMAVGYVMLRTSLYGELSSRTTIPFLKSTFIDLGILYVPFVALVVAATSNAVNLSDGLDGLAAGMIAPPAAAFGILAYVTGHARFSEYLNIPFLAGAGELTIYCAAVVGASLGFLWFNSHPAEVFMGDTGSLALGGGLGMVAVLIKRELLIFLVGGLFVAEMLSVVAQVVSFKLRGKRVLRMAPLHHHYELGAMAETKVVVRFWIISILLALITLSTIKLQ